MKNIGPGAGGLEIVSAWSTVMDHLIRHLYGAISSECGRRIADTDRSFALDRARWLRPGRTESALGHRSVVFYPRRISPFVQAVTEKLQHTLWDAGIEPGHATRSIADCIRLAESDMRVRTSLLDARFLCGDFALFQEFEKKVEPRLVKTGIQRFIREKLEENRARHAQYGGSVYLLEPEVKEGEGGLRDIQTARWIARAKLQC